MRPQIRSIAAPFFVLLGLLGSAAPASAQNAAPAPPPVVGGSVSIVTTGHDFDFLGGGTVIVLPSSRASALQLTFDLRPSRFTDGIEIDSIYTVQYRRTLGADADQPRVYLTMGAAGAITYSHFRASSYFTPERAKGVSATGVVTSTTPAHWTDVPARTRFRMSPPMLPVAGVGLVGPANRRVGFQADVTASVWPGFACRLSAAVTVALGQIARK